METMKIERRRANMIPTFRPKRRTFDRARIRTAAKYAVLTAAGILLFRAGHASALTERGYAAIGGEVFALFLPVLYYMISRTVRGLIECLQTEKEDIRTWKSTTLSCMRYTNTNRQNAQRPYRKPQRTLAARFWKP